MVKVLDNKLIDLDLFPGQKPADLLAKASELDATSPEKAKALRELAEQRSAALLAEVNKKTGGSGASTVVPEDGAQLENPGGVKGVGVGLVNTVGGIGKGVGDTLGNTIYSLGSGLGQTGVAAANGLTQAGSSAVGKGGSAKAKDEEVLGVGDNKSLEDALAKAREIQNESEDAKDESTEKIVGEAEEEKRRPKKIELRGADKGGRES